MGGGESVTAETLGTMTGFMTNNYFVDVEPLHGGQDGIGFHYRTCGRSARQRLRVR